MSFTAKVVATGEFFQATTDLGPAKDHYRDAHLPIEPKTFYLGHQFPGSQVATSQDVALTKIRFTKVVSVTFLGAELEVVTGDVRLIPVH
jgi:hypothetical protein